MGIARVGSAALALAFCALPAYSQTPLFGRHFPHGNDAVEYLYGPNGTWREQIGLYYGWNFYKHCEAPGHPYDPQALIRESSVSNSTAPDANCILLGDLNNNGEIADDTTGGYAFHEHAGRGVSGAQTAAPFYQFWFDDNWVARYVAEAYGRPSPAGLHDNGSSLRWRVLGADNRLWTPYPGSSPHIDQIALNGLFKLNAHDVNGALAAWHAIKNASGAAYDTTLRRYRYTLGDQAVYYYGLWAILSERLLAALANAEQGGEILQHAMSLRAELLALQEKDAGGNRLGWRTSTAANALINTETTSLSVLALGANASWVLEPGHAPLQTPAANLTHAPATLTAIAGQSVAGPVLFGPYWPLEPGRYNVEFALRSAAARIESPLATIDVYDGTAVVSSRVIEGADAPVADQWRRYSVVAEIGAGANLTEFRLSWHGAYDLDVGPVRVTRLAAAPAAVNAAPASQWTPSAAPAPMSSCPAPTKGVSAPQWLKSKIETYVKYLS
jgi:hypothetical protein